MKLSFFSMAAVLMLLSFYPTADKVQPGHRLAGLWTGTYTIHQMPEQKPLYYSFIFKTDGTLLTEGRGDNGLTYYSSGTWKIKDKTITAVFTTLNYPGNPVTQSAMLTYKNKNTLTNGTWKDVKNPSGFLSGDFQVMKKVK